MSPSYIFGPIESRRFGRSLGIDLSASKKQCNFDCLYCELEPKAPLAKSDEHIDIEMLITELKKALKEHAPVDVVTLTANGEPTMFEDFGLLVNRLNRIKEKTKLLVLSNASLIDKEEIQASLKMCDKVKLSLDSVNEETFKKLDRPDKSIDIKDIIKGLKSFSQSYEGELIIEILVVAGLNDTKEEMQAISKVLKEVKHTRIDLGTIDRPPAYGVEAVSSQTLNRLATFLAPHNVHVIEPKNKSLEPNFYTQEEIMATLQRRPLSLEDVQTLFDELSQSLLQKLLDEQKIALQKQGDKSFYILSENLTKKRQKS